MRSLAGLALAWVASGAAAGCGPSPEPCEVAGGSYHIVLPQTVEGPVPSVVFLHGHGGSGEGVLRMREMVAAFATAGYAVIAPDGAPRPNGTRSWSFRGDLATRDDFAFLPEVLADAADRYDIDAERSVLAGFSSGAFMVNYLACKTPEAFAAYLPVAGGFWRSMPETCTGPVRLYHSHGWRDGTVPLEGRILGNGRFIQGDIWAGFDLWRQAMGCKSPAPDQAWQEGDLMLREWHCGAKAELRVELFPGGHMVPEGWAERVITWLKAPTTGPSSTE